MAVSIRQRARNTEHKLERREALLSAARELWDLGTYESTTMAGIGQRAGVSKATVYLYFDTKEQLLLEILREKLDAAGTADKRHYMLTVAAPASGTYYLRLRGTYPDGTNSPWSGVQTLRSVYLLPWWSLSSPAVANP